PVERFLQPHETTHAFRLGALLGCRSGTEANEDDFDAQGSQSGGQFDRVAPYPADRIDGHEDTPALRRFSLVPGHAVMKASSRQPGGGCDGKWYAVHAVS